jgi:hypothetical protein
MKPPTIRLMLALAAAAASSAGCMMMMPGGARGAAGRSVDNPLVSHQPLEATSKGDVGTVGEADCNTWPFEDRLSVQVTEGQICVEQHKIQAAPPGWSGEPTADRSELVSVANETGAGGSINASKAHASKVGSCFNKGFNEQVAIWAFDYKGCAPNNGTVTAQTRSLSVGHESWSFAAPAAPAGAAAPATASTGASAARGG